MNEFDKARFSQAILDNEAWKEMYNELRTRYSIALESSTFEDTSRMQMYVVKLQMLKEIDALLKQNIEKDKKNN